VTLRGFYCPDKSGRVYVWATSQVEKVCLNCSRPLSEHKTMP
jgi:hypothetical protein